MHTRWGIESTGFMIAKRFPSYRVKSLRQEQILRDHGGTGEVIYVLSLEFPV
jgi:hypothetical protein